MGKTIKEEKKRDWTTILLLGIALSLVIGFAIGNSTQSISLEAKTYTIRCSTYNITFYESYNSSHYYECLPRDGSLVAAVQTINGSYVGKVKWQLT